MKFAFLFSHSEKGAQASLLEPRLYAHGIWNVDSMDGQILLEDDDPQEPYGDMIKRNVDDYAKVSIT